VSPQGWLLLGTIITAGGGLLGTWLLIRQQGRQSRTTDAQQIIDQLQEMRAADEERHRREIADLRTEVGALRTEVGEARHEIDDVKSRAERRELVFFDYVAALRWHIEQRKPPPPPPWPAALMNRG
jgi:chromosome segregation ATPase